jgi:hypothetical protein
MKKGITRTLSLTGWALIGLSIVFYATLQLATHWEQARTPGEKNMGAAVLLMIWGIPTLVTGRWISVLDRRCFRLCLQVFSSPQHALTRTTPFLPLAVPPLARAIL